MAFLAASPALAGVAALHSASIAAQADNAIVIAQADTRLPRPRPGAGLTTAEPAPEAPAAVPASDGEAADAPLPRARPAVDEAAVALRLDADFHGFAPDLALKVALDALESGRFGDARALAARHADPLAADLVDWLVARRTDSGLTAQEIIGIWKRHPTWPDQERMKLRAEQAFHALGPDHAAVLTFYSEARPSTVGGSLALAAALREIGRESDMRARIRGLWRQGDLSSGQAAALVARFGSELTPADHLHRFRRLVLNRRASDAKAQAALVGKGYDKLAGAVIAVLQRRPEGAGLLRGVAARFGDDPLYIFAKVRLLRRADKPRDAAKLVLDRQPDHRLAGDADIWWLERQDLSRQLLDAGAADLAYRVALEGRPVGESERVEAAFHAGWYALRFLDEPRKAEAHFREILPLATLPRTQSRASYWLGRSHEAAGAAAPARQAYEEAGRFGGTFYGQLAREKLGIATTGLERAPEPSALDRIRFADRDSVRAIRLLAAAGHAEAAYPFLNAVAETVQSPGEVTLLVALARRVGQPRAGMAAAAVADRRGLDVRSLPAPFLGIPARLPLPDPVDRALVYAVARQESAFNHRAQSGAGARGLMQLMPGTARQTARNAQLPFSLQRLTEDPLYNATLGAQLLGELLGRLDRSYILTFVGYNAGPSRARKWVETYGDPRGGAVDAIDWIERIPFDETRSYVQRVMENLQVYRSRLGYPLSLTEDLARGGPRS